MDKKIVYRPYQEQAAGQMRQAVDLADSEMFKELDRMQQDRMNQFAEMLEQDPGLVAQCMGHGYDGSMFNLSKLEKRVDHLPLHVLFAPKGRDPADQLSPTLRHGGTVRGVVHRYPRASDNLPRDERFHVGNIHKINVREHVARLGEVSMERDEARIQAMGAIYGLTAEQMTSAHYPSDFTPEGPKGPQVVHDEAPFLFFPDKGDGGKTVKINYDTSGGAWSSERRGRAATSAPVRKKLRAKTRAQKKARRKQR